MKHYTRMLALLCTPLVSSTPPLKQQDPVFKHFWSIAETIHTLEKKSFRAINAEKIIQAGLKAMVNEVDAHSTFFTPESYSTTLQFANGEFAGVGVSVNSKTIDDDGLLIIDIVPAGPSDKAGLESNDRIVEVDGEKVKGLSTDEVVNKLKGKRHSTVTVKIIRDKKPYSFTITRDLIKDLNCSAYFFPEQQTCYIAIKAFTDKTPALVKKHIEQAEKKQCESIILDLRRNSGGILESAVHTASLFVPHNSLIVQTRNSEHEVLREYRTKNRPIHNPQRPLFILTDNFTASSAEILAGSLKHYAQHAEGSDQQLLVFLVGMPTYGKGSVQELIPMSDGCALKLTSALYYLPNDTSIQAIGIQPDFLLYPKKAPLRDLQWIEEMYGKETALRNHISRGEVLGVNEEVTVQRTTVEPTSDSLEQEHQKSIAQDSMVRHCLNLSRLCTLSRTYRPDVAKHKKTLYTFLQKHNVADETITIRPFS